MKAGIEHWYRWSSSEAGVDVPSLEFLPSRARRRLSGISRAVLEVGHHLCVLAQPDSVVYASRYGETARQLEITRGLLDENEVSPSVFSYSVFNTPVALLSLHEGIKGRTRAVFGGSRSFSRGLMQAVLSRDAEQRQLFLFGDEGPPDTYLGDGEIPGSTEVIGMILGPAVSGTVVEVRPAGNDGMESADFTTADMIEWLDDRASELVLAGTGYNLVFHSDC